MDTIEKQRFRILVVDDNASIHEDFRKVLNPAAVNAELSQIESALFDDPAPSQQEESFEIDSAYQGQEGLQRVEQAIAEGRPYAMPFVDVRMPPGWDGIETIEHIWKKYPALQVVVCTAYSDYSWEEIVRKLGASDKLLILKKPFDSVEVLQLAHALTRKWLLERQASLRMADLDQMVRLRTEELVRANGQLEAEVSRRARVESELRHSEERFQKAFASSSECRSSDSTRARRLTSASRWPRSEEHTS